MLRLLTVKLAWAYAEFQEDATAQPPAEARRDRLGNLGFDVTKMKDEDLIQAPCIGMTDTQFVELSIAGEKEMQIIASCIIDVTQA